MKPNPYQPPKESAAPVVRGGKLTVFQHIGVWLLAPLVVLALIIFRLVFHWLLFGEDEGIELPPGPWEKP